MRFSVRHETVYRYSVPVQLSAHVVRLNPRAESVRVVTRNLNVEPQPATRRERTDAFGNLLTDLTFYGWTQALRIESKLELETWLPSPLFPMWPRLPWFTNLNDGLAAYRADAVLDPTVQRFANELAGQVFYEPLSFLDRLTQTLCTRTDQQLRIAGDANSAASTLLSAQGTCRDLTVLFMSVCRSLGLACRFMSGYLAPVDNFDAQRQLHAWPEVFLPGVGWRGWDPSQGQRVTDAHVPLCTAPTQNATMPVAGTFVFNGEVVNTTLDYDIRIRAT